MDCCDAAGEFAGFVRWDADKGELIELSRNASPSSVPAPDLTRAQAISRTRLLLRQREIGLPVGPWHLSDSPCLSHDCWHVKMASARTGAMLVINKHTGQITYMRFSKKESALVH